MKGKLRKTENRAENWIELTEKTFDFATYTRRHFISDDIETKKDIIRGLGSNFILKDRKVAIQANEWGLCLLKTISRDRGGIYAVRTGKNPYQ